MSAEVRLEPCPECGNAVRMVTFTSSHAAHPPHETTYWVDCDPCYNSWASYPTEPEAALAWNRVALAGEAFELLAEITDATGPRKREQAMDRARALLARVQPEPEVKP